MLSLTKTIVMVSPPLVADNVMPLVSFCGIIVLCTFIVTDIAFAVSDAVGGAFGMGRLHFVLRWCETIVAFYISEAKVRHACFRTQNRFQRTAGINGD